MAQRSLENLGLPRIDLLQFHVWEDDWAGDERWQRAVDDLKRQGLVGGVGVSVNRWEPTNVVRTLRTGLIDAVQVIYNIFDQAPEDELFPLCRELGVAVIARVPFDEGSLTGTLTKDSRWPEGDWRNTYFVPENLIPTVDRVEALKPVVPAGMALPEMAMRFILSNPDVATVIPGMRQPANVRANLAASDAGPLPAELLARLRAHRWDRTPASWSQ
jgi:aryl-alcohol dehydrogenase-like predicted oxidoreductase